ncbi:subtilase-type protease inhibitor [Streptomyces sp. NPDC052236]|uniref:subtilase-type protease inhibitor n=1 Tax=Streptomyces sp. NPDC052236 TaxID=3365686 RepID=UPI0037D6EB7B
MRYIRTTLTAASIATATALVLTGTAAAGVAHAQPAGLYAPSALVLAIGKGERAATATVERAVTLNCAPRPTGTHPAPASACAELRSVDGRFAALTEEPSQKMCTRQWDPVVVTAQGVWDGKHVSWSATFGNACEMEGTLAESSTVFAF